MGSIVFRPSLRKYDPDIEPPRVGFDPDGPWQMVPHKGERYLHLKVTEIKDWSLESLDENVATIEEVTRVGLDRTDHNVYAVRGANLGKTALIAKGPKGEQRQRIEIVVKKQITKSVKFYVVTDKTGRKATFTDKDTKAWTEFMNTEVFEPQINVHFDYVDTVPIKVDVDLGDRIDFKAIGDMPFVKREGKAGENWHSIVDAGKVKSDVFNVFCVWDFENYETEGGETVAFVASRDRITSDQMAKSGQNYNICMFRQKASKDWYFKYVLAHEAGHYLNRMPAHTSGKDQLMTPGAAGSVLDKGDAARMNP
jgi:hypothetical protein